MQDEYGARSVPREDWMLKKDRSRRDMRCGGGVGALQMAGELLWGRETREHL